jgi:hypothetical protein
MSPCSKGERSLVAITGRCVVGGVIVGDEHAVILVGSRVGGVEALGDGTAVQWIPAAEAQDVEGVRRWDGGTELVGDGRPAGPPARDPARVRSPEANPGGSMSAKCQRESEKRPLTVRSGEKSPPLDVDL